MDNQNDYNQNKNQEFDHFNNSNHFQEQSQFQGQNQFDGHDPYQRSSGTKTKLRVALALGIVAFVLPVPYVDIISGIIGIILVIITAKEVPRSALWGAALVMNIVGLIQAIVFTLGAIGISLY